MEQNYLKKNTNVSTPKNCKIEQITSKLKNEKAIAEVVPVGIKPQNVCNLYCWASRPEGLCFIL